MQLQTQLQADYVKWDNLRVLNLIKESDLKLLGNAVIEHNQITNMLQIVDLANDEYPEVSFVGIAMMT